MTYFRAVNEMWRDHIFQMAVTFHGGMQAIAYEWGGTNHPSKVIQIIWHVYYI